MKLLYYAVVFSVPCLLVGQEEKRLAAQARKEEADRKKKKEIEAKQKLEKDKAAAKAAAPAATAVAAYKAPDPEVHTMPAEPLACIHRGNSDYEFPSLGF